MAHNLAAGTKTGTKVGGRDQSPVAQENKMKAKIGRNEKDSVRYRIQYQTSDHPVGPYHRTLAAAERAVHKALRQQTDDQQGISIVTVEAR